jgi:uncharacterized membrane protein YidH (DUF202 family)
MSRFLKFLSATPIANTGSVARDHLANERTFLSWNRTGLGFVALGVVLAKLEALEALSPALQRDHGDLKIPAAALIGSGTGCLTYGTTRYFASMKLLQRGLFRPNIAGIGLVAVTSAAVAGGVIVVVISQEKKSKSISVQDKFKLGMLRSMNGGSSIDRHESRSNSAGLDDGITHSDIWNGFDSKAVSHK